MDIFVDSTAGMFSGFFFLELQCCPVWQCEEDGMKQIRLLHWSRFLFREYPNQRALLQNASK
jgi:hypothetical protein